MEIDKLNKHTSFNGLKVTSLDRTMGTVIEKFIDNIVGYKPNARFIIKYQNESPCPILNIFRAFSYIGTHSCKLHEKLLENFQIAQKEREALENHGVMLEDWEANWFEIFSEIVNGYRYSNLKKLFIKNGKNNPNDLISLQVGMVFGLYNGDKSAMKELVDLHALYSENNNNAGFCGIAAFVYEELKDLDKSQEFINKGQKLCSTNIWIHHVYIHVLYTDNKIKESIDYLENTKHLWDTYCNTFLNKHIRWHLAVVYLEIGEYDKGNKLINKICKNPFDEAECGLSILGYIIRLFLNSKEFIINDEIQSWIDVMLKYFLKKDIYTCHLLFDALAFWLMSFTDNVDLLNTSMQALESNIETIKDEERKVYLKTHYINILKGVICFGKQEFDNTLKYLIKEEEAITRIGASNEQLQVLYEIELYCCQKLNDETNLKRIQQFPLFGNKYTN
jgi:hypothetical protein